MKHIIMRLTCWLWVDWRCMARGGGVGTGLGAQVGFWDWDVPHLPLRLLGWLRSFWKVLTACGGWNNGKLLVKQTPPSTTIMSSPPFPSNSNIKNIFSIFFPTHLSEKFIGYQGVRGDVWLATSRADVLIWIQQGSANTWAKNSWNVNIRLKTFYYLILAPKCGLTGSLI